MVGIYDDHKIHVSILALLVNVAAFNKGVKASSNIYSGYVDVATNRPRDGWGIFYECSSVRYIAYPGLLDYLYSLLSCWSSFDYCKAVK